MMRHHGDTDRSRPDSALEPALQLAPYESPAHWDQQQESDDVRQHARRDQKGRRNQNQHTINDRHGGRPALAKVSTQAREGVDTLLFRQRGPDDTGPDDQSQGGDRANTLTDLDEQDQLDGRHDDEEQ